MNRTLVVFLLVVSLLVGALPPGYAGLLAFAKGHGAVSEANYEKALQVVMIVGAPSRVVLSVTPFDGALESSHMPFFSALAASVIGGWIGWFTLLLMASLGFRVVLNLFWASRRRGRLRQEPPR